jgi:hypothetical protein
MFIDKAAAAACVEEKEEDAKWSTCDSCTVPFPTRLRWLPPSPYEVARLFSFFFIVVLFPLTTTLPAPPPSPDNTP